MSTTAHTVVHLSVQSTVSSTNASGQQTTSQVGTTIGELILRNGIGYDQADLAGSKVVTIAASSNSDVDLVGDLVDGQGNVVTFAKIKYLIILNPSLTQTLQVKPAASNGWTGMLADATDKLNIAKAAFASTPNINVWSSPQGTAITAGTGDLINIINPAGASVDVTVIAIGTSS
jgi:hypothetical protein